MKHARPRQRGLTLVELMVSVAIGLLILLGLAKIYASNAQVRANIERNSRHLENGRYALKTLSSDLRLAGYLGEYFSLSAPSTLPANPCSTALADLRTDFPVHIQGYNNSDGGLACLSDYRGGDVIVIRRVATCSAANPNDSGCDAVTSGEPYFQVSGCSTDTVAAYAPTGNLLPFRLDTNAANLSLLKIGCTSGNLASIRRFHTHIYYLANNNLAGDGIPTLKRWELGGSNNPVPLAEGIEDLQFSYGIDTDNNGTPDTYKDSPSGIAEWNAAVSVKIDLISRSDAPSNQRRHEYHTTVLLENPAGRKQ